ncbi:MIZ/SP-RING zinc finger domain-containing protein [Ditylenchus destructor]|nr:MIZ/SP-RING zinc finger domain-containing protein [Ditylenchus destructor]
MDERPRRYNMRDRRKKKKGILLREWEPEYKKLCKDNQKRIPQQQTTTAIRNAFAGGMLQQLRISLKCQLSGQRVKVPARYADCKHIECFDLETFLQMKTKANLLVCPICQNDVEDASNTGLENLRIDRYIENVLSTLPNAMHIDLQPDGSFTEVHEQAVAREAPAVIDDIEADVQDGNTPVFEIKQEVTDCHISYITLGDSDEEGEEETSTCNVNINSLMPLDIDVKPEICQELQSTPSDPNKVTRVNSCLYVVEDAVIDFSPPEAPQMLVTNYVHSAEEDESQSAIGGGAEKISKSKNVDSVLQEQLGAISELSTATAKGVIETHDIYNFGISLAIRENKFETNAGDHSCGTIEDVQDSNVTNASAIVTESGNNVFACCELCNSRVSKHDKRHEMRQHHKCDQCSFSSPKRSQLNIHMLSHAGIKIYECDHCPYITNDLRNLKKHMRQHPEERNRYARRAQTKQGKLKFIHESYEFWLSYNSADGLKSSWRCAKFQKSACQCRIQVEKATNKVIKKFGDHNGHGIDPVSIPAQLFKNNVKQRAAVTVEVNI